MERTLEPLVYSAKDTAELLGFDVSPEKVKSSKEAVYRLIKAGQLKAVQRSEGASSKYLVTAESIRAFVTPTEE